jgi:hypothetical protein
MAQNNAGAIYAQVTMIPPATFSLNTIYIGGVEFSPNISGQYVFTNIDNSRVANMLSQGWALANVS